jgi:geranylgeranyl diphosphate synthase type I
VSTSALLDVEGVRDVVDTLVRSHLRSLSAEVAAIGLDDSLVAALRAGVGGGKRLRAAFCYWSWRAHGGSAGDPGTLGTATAPVGTATRTDVLTIGAALELFQAAALVHDDVMDDSDTRRGRPAAHRHFADLHTRGGWAGSSTRFGESVAILLGDLALIAAERVFDEAVADLAPSVRRSIEEVFGGMRTEVIAGQYLDLVAQVQPWGDDPADDEETARTVVRAKSARYSVEHPLTLGATAAGADDVALERICSIGLPLGEAFQLRDDLLGVFGDPGTTGKPAGDDLREGKHTVLVARALRAASTADRAALLDGLGRRDLTDDDVARLREVLHRTGADAEVEELIASLAGPALEALAAAPLAEPGRGMLLALAQAAVDRLA